MAELFQADKEFGDRGTNIKRFGGFIVRLAAIGKR